MRLTALLLAATLGDPATEVALAPAPGAPPAPTLSIDGAAVALDQAGRGRIASAAAPTGDRLRFYRPSSEQIFYYPEDGTLVTWPLSGADATGASELFVKDSAESWEEARAYLAPLEPDDSGKGVRFVLPPGAWDAAVVVPGRAPAFAMGIRAAGEPLALARTPLPAAGRVRARILDARSGKPPDRWEAYVERVGADPKSEESKFFGKRSIAQGGSALDFASLPVGGWELKVRAPGRSEPRVAVKVPKAGALADLGDVYVTDFGTLRVVLEFPGEVPPGIFEIGLKRPRLDVEAPAIELASRRVTPERDVTLEFSGIEPGAVSIVCTNAEAKLRRDESVFVEPNRIAEARILVRPLRIHGTVRQGDRRVAGASVTGLQGPDEERRPEPAMSDELGGYELRTWGGGAEALMLTTRVPGEGFPFVEFVEVDPDASDIEHDVRLPAAEIRGVVRDAETGVVIAGASVEFSTALAEEEPGRAGDAATLSIGLDSDDDGRFRLANLAEDPLDVGVSHEGYSPSRFPSVRPTPEGTELEVRLERGIRLSGIVSDEAGAPIPGALVGLDVDAQGLDFARFALTSADGRYEFGDVGRGAHDLGVFSCGRTLVLRRFTIADSERNEAAGRTENLELIPEGIPIAVTIENEDGSPAAMTTFRWAVAGAALPFNAWTNAARACGNSDVSDPNGRLVLHGFPVGAISALSLSSQTVYGTFANDGSSTEWTIRLPARQRLETGRQATQ